MRPLLVTFVWLWCSVSYSAVILIEDFESSSSDDTALESAASLVSDWSSSSPGLSNGNSSSFKYKNLGGQKQGMFEGKPLGGGVYLPDSGGADISSPFAVDGDTLSFEFRWWNQGANDKNPDIYFGISNQDPTDSSNFDEMDIIAGIFIDNAGDVFDVTGTTDLNTNISSDSETGNNFETIAIVVHNGASGDTYDVLFNGAAIATGLSFQGGDVSASIDYFVLFADDNHEARAYLDDISFTNVPEPGTLLLAGTAMCFLWFIQRRRKQGLFADKSL